MLKTDKRDFDKQGPFYCKIFNFDKLFLLRKYLLFFLLLFCRQSAGQNYVINLKQWDVKSGLIHRQVNYIYEDRRGFIWIGTPGGLCCFDGIKFISFTREKDGLPFNDIDFITEDIYNRLWLMATKKVSDNVFIFDPLTLKVETVSKITHTTRHACYLYSLSDSGILLRYDQGGDIVWHPSTGITMNGMPGKYEFITFLKDPDAYLVQNDKNELIEMDVHGRLLHITRMPVSVKRIGNYLPGSGIYLRDKLSQHIFFVSPDHQIREMHNFLPKLDPEINDMFNTGLDGITCRFGRLFHPRQGMLRDFVKDGIRDLRYQKRFVMKDSQKRFWIGNDFGLFLLTIVPNKFRAYFEQPPNDFFDNSYRTILVDDSVLYACDEKKGVFSKDLRSGREQPLLMPAERTSGCFSVAKMEGGIFFASVGRNLVSISVGKQPISYNLALPKGHDCWVIYPFSAQRLLLGLWGGLMWFDIPSKKVIPFEQYNKFTELASSLIVDISADSGGLLRICSNSGFYAFDTAKGIVARYSSADSGICHLPANEFQHYCRDADGTYWLATTSGLVHWDMKVSKYRLYNKADGMSNENIYSVYADNYNGIWTASDYGIMHFDKRSGRFKAYLVQDGVTNNEFNRLAHFKDQSGNIYFGTLNGITAFNPSVFLDTGVDQHSSNLVISSFQQFNGETNKLENRIADLMHTNVIKMYPDDRFFTITFSLLNFNDPERTTYYWKIDGVDTGWNSQGDPELRLSRLPYGRRTLHIKAIGADGNPGKNELSIQLLVLKPFYLQTWLILLCIMFMVGAIVGIYRWRVYRLKRENERLDIIIKEKTRDLQASLQQKEVLLKEIHHRVKNNLQVISSLLRLQANSVKDEAAKQAILEGQNRVLSIALIHQKLYQDERLDTVEFATFAQELFGQLNSVFGRNINPVKFINEVPKVYSNIDIAVPLGLMLNELVTNSFKYAFPDNDSPQIKLSFAVRGGMQIIYYHDNGPGLPAGIDIDKTKSLGLRLINRLSNQIEGKVTYKYEGGSLFTITYPKN